MEKLNSKTKILKFLALLSPFLYIVFFVLYVDKLGNVVNFLGIVPLFIIGAVYGVKGGIITGAGISIAASLTRIFILGDPNFQLGPAISSGIVGAVAGAVIGLLNDQQKSLRVARQKAEEADKFKTLFMASMTHELRTPLNAIINFSEMLALGMLGAVNEEQQKMLEDTKDSGRHLLQLINDILDVSKIQSGMFTLFIEENINLYEEVDSVISMTESLLREREIQFIQDIDRDIPLMKADKRRVRQILLNLVSNAVKYTSEGTITLSIKKKKGNLLIAVMDTGPGIPKDQQNLIFEPFTQTDLGISKQDSSGLGLSISKEIVEAHGGKLWVESEMGQGATFFAEIPLIYKNNKS